MRGEGLPCTEHRRMKSWPSFTTRSCSTLLKTGARPSALMPAEKWMWLNEMLLDGGDSEINQCRKAFGVTSRRFKWP